MSPTTLALVVSAYADGDLQTIGKKGVEPLCILVALTPERIEEFKRKYQGNSLTADGKVLA